MYHSMNGPGLSGPGGSFMLNLIGPPRPLMLSLVVFLDHLYHSPINGLLVPINAIMQNDHI